MIRPIYYSFTEVCCGHALAVSFSLGIRYRAFQQVRASTLGRDDNELNIRRFAHDSKDERTMTIRLLDAKQE